MSTSYKRPPITEAIIELRFSAPAVQEQVEKAAGKIKRRFVYREPETGQSFHLDVAKGTSSTTTTWIGMKLSSADRTEMAILRTETFAYAQLAPYPGWDNFFTRARETWTELGDVPYGRRAIGRIGVRFVNRLDIPGALKKNIDSADYLTVGPKLPALDWAPIRHYFVQVVRPLGADNCTVSINTGIVPSPLVGYQSILLDIDIFNDGFAPQDEDAMWDMIARVRDYKNRIFEASITDAARELFNS